MSLKTKSSKNSLRDTKSAPVSSTSKPKRKVQVVSSDSSDEDCQIVTTSSSNDQKDKLNLLQSIDWLKNFAPKEVSDLAVHPKKIEELRSWFRIPCAKIPNKILLIEGPTGCAKTTALKLIAKEFDYDISEWINSTDLEKALLYENSENFNQDFVSYENQLEKFTDFLLHSSRYDSVFSNNKKRLLLIKDFPNTFLKKNEEFWEVLRRFAADGLAPLIFIITETQSRSLNISYNLFPEKIRMELGIDCITLNPISATLMKRGVKRIVQLIDGNSSYKSNFKKPSEDVLETLIDQGGGDIRHTILNLSFASQLSNFKIPANLSKNKKGGKKKKNSDVGLGKNEGLSLMHGVGRVLYPKFELNEDTNLIELTHKPETIAESFSSQPGNFIRLVHSNYMKNFGCINELATAAEMFSLSDCIEAEYRDSQLSLVNLDFVIRSTMVLNRNHPSGFRPVSAYANKKWIKIEEANRGNFREAATSLNNGNIVAPNDFFCDYKHFMSLINK